MAMSRLDKNNAVLSVLGHPTRRKIMRRLEQGAEGGVSPKQLAEELQQSVPLVAYHMRLLAQAGVLKLVSTQPRRGAVEHFYTRSGSAVDQRAKELLSLIGKE